MLNDYNFRPLVDYISKHNKDLFDFLGKYSIRTVPLGDYVYDETNEIIFIHEFSELTPFKEKLGKNTFIFSFDYSKLNKHKFYYCIYLFQLMLNPTQISNIDKINTKYLFSCASRNFNNYRPGKIFNYLKLKDKDYFNKILFTKFQLETPFEMYYFNELVDPELYKYAKQIEREYYTWPMVSKDGPTSLTQSLWSFDLNVYRDSLFHIIAETSVELPYISEKTYKIFNAGQIPIMSGPKGAIGHLRNLGFDVFDDIVDHSYDNIDDWKTRILTMHESLDKLITQDHEKIKFDTYQRRLYNQKRLTSIELQQLVFDPIVTRLKEHFQGEKHGR